MKAKTDNCTSAAVKAGVEAPEKSLDVLEAPQATRTGSSWASRLTMLMRDGKEECTAEFAHLASRISAIMKVCAGEPVSDRSNHELDHQVADVSVRVGTS